MTDNERDKEREEQEWEDLAHNHEKLCHEAESGMRLDKGEESRRKQRHHHVAEHDVGDISADRASEFLYDDG